MVYDKARQDSVPTAYLERDIHLLCAKTEGNDDEIAVFVVCILSVMRCAVFFEEIYAHIHMHKTHKLQHAFSDYYYYFHSKNEQFSKKSSKSVL